MIQKLLKFNNFFSRSISRFNIDAYQRKMNKDKKFQYGNLLVYREFYYEVYKLIATGYLSFKVKYIRFGINKVYKGNTL